MVRTRLERSIDIDVPVTAVYNQWTQFEEFPNFMDGCCMTPLPVIRNRLGEEICHAAL